MIAAMWHVADNLNFKLWCGIVPYKSNSSDYPARDLILPSPIDIFATFVSIDKWIGWIIAPLLGNASAESSPPLVSDGLKEEYVKILDTS